eukprot:194531-Prorocentrum_minimum.AAC.2
MGSDSDNDDFEPVPKRRALTPSQGTSAPSIAPSRTKDTVHTTKGFPPSLASVARCHQMGNREHAGCSQFASTSSSTTQLIGSRMNISVANKRCTSQYFSMILKDVRVSLFTPPTHQRSKTTQIPLCTHG